MHHELLYPFRQRRYGLSKKFVRSIPARKLDFLLIEPSLLRKIRQTVSVITALILVNIGNISLQSPWYKVVLSIIFF
jgi:hypothetical protein